MIFTGLMPTVKAMKAKQVLANARCARPAPAQGQAWDPATRAQRSRSVSVMAGKQKGAAWSTAIFRRALPYSLPSRFRLSH